ncbi:MAG: hypothetical protein ACREIU_08425 [Planctomycetota bacterium]
MIPSPVRRPTEGSAAEIDMKGSRKIARIAGIDVRVHATSAVFGLLALGERMRGAA